MAKKAPKYGGYSGGSQASTVDTKALDKKMASATASAPAPQTLPSGAPYVPNFSGGGGGSYGGGGYSSYTASASTPAPAMSADDWLNAGNRFNDAYRFTQDSTIQAALVVNAVEAFQHATKLKPDNLDAKAGLGVADVNGGDPSPMTGIGMLLAVVSKDPKNWSANFNLGMFAMKSGQYDKAVERFKTLIAQKTEVEPYFYLAESYKQLGMKKEAIEAYQKCKELTPDPDFGKRIDDFIKELKN